MGMLEIAYVLWGGLVSQFIGKVSFLYKLWITESSVQSSCFCRPKLDCNRFDLYTTETRLWFRRRVAPLNMLRHPTLGRCRIISQKLLQHCDWIISTPHLFWGKGNETKQKAGLSILAWVQYKVSSKRAYLGEKVDIPCQTKKKKKATDKWGVGRGNKEPLFTTIGTLLKSYGFSVIYSTLIRSLLNLMDPDNFFQLIL